MFTRFKNGYDNGPSELVRIKIDGTKEKVIISAADSDQFQKPEIRGHFLFWTLEF